MVGSIEVLFEPNAPIFKKLYWKEEFLNSFNKWQQERNVNFNPRFEFLLDTQLEILEPTKPTSYLLVYPSEFLGDISGDQFDLRRKMSHALEAYNYLHRHDRNFVPIDIDVLAEIKQEQLKMHKNNGIDGKIHN